MAEPAAIVGQHFFLRGLPAEYIGRLADIAHCVSLPADYRLFEESVIADRVWLIEAGQVTLDLLVPGQGRMVIELLGRGDVLGLSWLQSPYIWRYGAITKQHMQALEFDARDVRKELDSDPAFGYALVSRFAGVAAHRLQATRAQLLAARTAIT